MATEKNIIVALELATTAIRAIAGQRMSDGTLQVLAVAEENASNCIRKGVIDNIDKTTQAISRVLGQISLSLGKTVRRVYVGLGGQSLHTTLNVVKRPFAEKTQVTNDMIDQLMDTNRGVVYTDSEILEVVPQEYQLGGSRIESEVVGMQVDQLEARFLNIVARTSLSENIEKCVEAAGCDIAELLITPLALADTMLPTSEKRPGCALVDIGADTTTVSIFNKNILRKLVVLPLGGNNVTTDIVNCLSLEQDEAEMLKIQHGAPLSANLDPEKNKEIKLSHDRTVDQATLSDIVEARYEEILMNVWNQIKTDKEKLTSGIIFTGGAAQIKGLPEAFQRYSRTDKQLRISKGLPSDISTAPGVHISDNGRMNSLLAILLHGDMNCVSTPDPKADDKRKKEAEEEARRQAEEQAKREAEVRKAVEEASKPAEEPKPKKEKKPSKFWKMIKDALTDDEV